MSFPWSLAENLKILKCYQGAADSVTCDVVSLKNIHKGWFVIVHSGSADTDLVLSLYEATDVAAGTNAAVTTACPIWADTDSGTTSDVIAATTAAYSYTIDTTLVPNQLVIMEVDPAILSDGYDCVYLADSGGNASNVCTILFVGAPRYTGATLAAAITD